MRVRQEKLRSKEEKNVEITFLRNWDVIKISVCVNYLTENTDRKFSIKYNYYDSKRFNVLVVELATNLWPCQYFFLS